MTKAGKSATNHEIVNLTELGPASGFSHAVVAQGTRTVFVAGQAAQGSDGSIQGGTMAEQFGIAVANLALTLERAGAKPDDLVSIQIFTTDIEAYRAAEREIGLHYREHLGRHYPAMALLEVSRLYDPGALVELVAIAVVSPPS